MDRSQIKCVAVVQCAVAHERCPGTKCAGTFVARQDYFAGYGPEAKYYVAFECGGCPGRRVGRLVSTLKKQAKKHYGIEPGQIVVHLATCVVSDNGHYPPCPHVKDIRAMIARKGFHFVEGSYVSAGAAKKREAGVYGPLPPRDNIT